MTPYRVELAPATVRVFIKLPADVRTRLREALERLARDAATPGRIGGKAGKTIKGADDSFHRLRVGDYRLMYDAIDEDRVILVLGVVHQGELERWIRSR